VEVVNASERVLTVEPMFSCVKTIEFEERVHAAVEMAAPLSVAWQAETAVREKALVKVRERSKLVLKVVMALRTIWYWELVEPAVLGEAVADETAKLT